MQEKISLITRDLIKGSVDFKDIPENLHNEIFNYLEETKKKYIRQGDVDNLKILQKIIAKLKGKIAENKEEFKEKRLLANLHPQKISVPLESLENIVEDIANGEEVIIDEPEILPELASFTKKKTDILLLEGEFEDAQLYEDIHSTICQVFPSHSRKGKKQQALLDIRNKISIAKQTHYRLIQERENLKLRMNLITEQNEVDIRSKHDEELSAFDEETLKMPPAFFPKHSQRLFELREIEKHLVLSRRFAEYGAIKAEADELEELEKRKAQEKWLNSRRIQRRALIESQQKTLESDHRSNERQIRRKIKDIDVQIESVLKGIQWMERRISEMIGDPRAAMMSSSSITAPASRNYSPIRTPMVSAPETPSRSKVSSPRFFTPKPLKRSIKNC